MKKTPVVTLAILIIALLSLSFFIFFVSETNKISEIENNTVVNVIDGDTFEYYDADSESIKTVRLICVDAPEKGKEGYEESKIFLQNLILGKQIYMEKDISETDKYGRLLRYIYLDDIFINKLVLDENHAKLLIIPPDECKELLD